MKHFIKREFDYEERKRPSIRLWGTEDSQLPLSFKDCLRGGGVSTVTHAVISVSLGKRGKESQDSAGIESQSSFFTWSPGHGERHIQQQ